MSGIVVVSAGLGIPSSSRMLADQLAAAARTACGRTGDVPEAFTIELREFAVDIANNLVTGFAPPRLREVIDRMTAADALIVVTPVFSASYSGLLKSFFDVLDTTALEGLPVLMGATGGSARHSLMLDHAMRPLFSYLRARVVPTAVYASSEDWGAGEEGAPALNARISRAADELAAMVSGSPVRRNTTSETSPPFEDLLASLRS